MLYVHFHHDLGLLNSVLRQCVHNVVDHDCNRFLANRLIRQVLDACERIHVAGVIVRTEDLFCRGLCLRRCGRCNVCLLFLLAAAACQQRSSNRDHQ